MSGALKRAPLLVRVHVVPAHTEKHMVVFNLCPDSTILRKKTLDWTRWDIKTSPLDLTMDN